MGGEDVEIKGGKERRGGGERNDSTRLYTNMAQNDPVMMQLERPDG